MAQSPFINRELSWLEFNQRVLDEALDPRVPLLERLKFLAITSSNLDEFFRVRVGGLQMLAERRVTTPDPSGRSPSAQLEAISERTHRMTADQYRCYIDQLEPALSAAGLRILKADELNPRQSATAEQFFNEELFSVLTPMAVSATDEQPLLRTQTLIIAVRLDPATPGDEDRFAFIPFGGPIPRFITLPAESGYDCIRAESVIGMFVDRFFPGEQVCEWTTFRISRNADLTVREDLAADLLHEMEELLDARQDSACVRLEVSDSASAPMLAFLRSTLRVEAPQIFSVPGPIDLSAMMTLGFLAGFDELRYETWTPQPSPTVDPAAGMFEQLARRDIVLYHPFEQFEPVLRLVDEAADDPDVLAIKQTLYRTSADSPIIAALKRAAERGKFVTVLVELRARFDEARNIEWAKDLERTGVQVIYGIKGLKTHCKVLIVVRREPGGIQRYVHFGTGNYNEKTAALYTDVSFMTSDHELGSDATAFFNTINGYSQLPQFSKISAAPISLRERLLEMIRAEIAYHRQGHRAHIMAKFNSLADPAIIEALYEASGAGVRIELNVRGICCLRPGVPGLSERITVTSIIDRYLEHSRIFYFRHGGDERVYISSADCMTRNLDKRVELLVPAEQPAARDRLIEILRICMNDRVKGRSITPDGGYTAPPGDGASGIGSQETLYNQARNAVAQAERARRLIFDPYRAPETRKG